MFRTIGGMSKPGLPVRVLAAIGMAGCLAVSLSSCGQPSESIQGSLDQMDELENTREAIFTETNQKLSINAGRLKQCLSKSDIDFYKMLDAGAEAEAERLRYTRALYQCEPDLDQVDEVVLEFMYAVQVQIGDSATVSVDEGRCMVRYLLDNSDDPALTMAIGEREEDLDLFVASMEECLPTETTDALFKLSGPMTYGDNERLDLAYEGCESGDMRLCDILFWISADGSDYFELSEDCAGRTPATRTSCSREGEVDENTLLAPPGSPYPQQLADECVAGDMVACDLLFHVSALDSDHNDTAHTCGGRIGIGALPDCLTVLGEDAKGSS